MWSLFFLVVTGRAQQQDDLTAEEYEAVFEILYGISKTAPFDVKTTEGMHYRRYVAQHERRHGGESPEARKVVWRTAGVSDGKGFVFGSHTGGEIPAVFCRSPQGMSATIRWSTSTVARLCSSLCAIPTCGKGSAVSANTGSYAVARARGHML